MTRWLKSALEFLGDHPAGVAWTVALVLLLVVILQNVEPVRIDVFFWSLPWVPKLVLILVSMAVGALLSEGLRMVMRRRARRARAASAAHGGR